MGRKGRALRQKVEKEDMKKNPNTDDEGEDTEESFSDENESKDAKQVAKKRLDTSEDEGEADDECEESEGPSKGKAKTDESLEEYEVELIVADRKKKKKNQYLVRWKGYTHEHDTWEDEDNLDCKELLDEYIRSKQKNKNTSDHENIEEPSVSRARKGKKRTKGKHQKISKQESPSKKIKPAAEPDANGEFVVSRIIDTHRAKDGKNIYLVQWKGYPASESSWEPEENVKDTAAFDKFLKRLEQAKSTPLKQLRVARTPTDRFTLTPQSTIRRASRRFDNKQRTKYYEAE